MIRISIGLLMALLCSAVELSVSPDRIFIDARQVQPAEVRVRLGAVGTRPIAVVTEQLDLFTLAAGPGLKVGNPVFPYSARLESASVVPGNPVGMLVRFAPELGSHAARAWGVTTDTLRLVTDEPGMPSYHVPVNIRYHTRPILDPREPSAEKTEDGWSIVFSLTSGSSEERISRVEVDSAFVMATRNVPKSIQVGMERAADGVCRMRFPPCPPGQAAVTLAVYYDLPAEVKKLLQVRFPLGGAPDVRREAGAAPAPAPGIDGALRRVRIR